MTLSQTCKHREHTEWLTSCWLWFCTTNTYTNWRLTHVVLFLDSAVNKQVLNGNAQVWPYESDGDWLGSECTSHLTHLCYWSLTASERILTENFHKLPVWGRQASIPISLLRCPCTFLEKNLKVIRYGWIIISQLPWTVMAIFECSKAH